MPSMLTCHWTVRGVFLVLSKAFDRVWLDGFFYKLKSNGIDGNLFKLWVVFKQQISTGCSQWSIFSLEIGYKWCAAGSVQAPLFFLIYINDLPVGLNTDVKLFADNTSLF